MAGGYGGERGGRNKWREEERGRQSLQLGQGPGGCPRAHTTPPGSKSWVSLPTSSRWMELSIQTLLQLLSRIVQPPPEAAHPFNPSQLAHSMLHSSRAEKASLSALCISPCFLPCPVSGAELRAPPPSSPDLNPAVPRVAGPSWVLPCPASCWL